MNWSSGVHGREPRLDQTPRKPTRRGGGEWFGSPITRGVAARSARRAAPASGAAVTAVAFGGSFCAEATTIRSASLFRPQLAIPEAIPSAPKYVAHALARKRWKQLHRIGDTAHQGITAIERRRAVAASGVQHRSSARYGCARCG
jgi:hypothetical protein